MILNFVKIRLHPSPNDRMPNIEKKKNKRQKQKTNGNCNKKPYVCSSFFSTGRKEEETSVISTVIRSLAQILAWYQYIGIDTRQRLHKIQNGSLVFEEEDRSTIILFLKLLSFLCSLSRPFVQFCKTNNAINEFLSTSFDVLF